MNSAAAFLRSIRTRPSWSLGLVILAWTAMLSTYAGLLVAERAPAFSRAFLLLLRLDLVLLPWFAGATTLALLYGSRAARLVPAIEAVGRRPWLVAAVVLAVVAAVAPGVYLAHPLSMDEYAVHFQSRVFAAGRLTGHFPPAWLPRLVPPEFRGGFLLVSPTTGAVASAYWPGFALLMAPFARFDLAWLCNPVLTAVSVVVLMSTTRRLFPDKPAAVGWATAFACASPVFAVLGMSYYAMTSLMLGNMLFLHGFLNPGPGALFWSGVAGSVALTLHNPLPHLLFALPWIGWLVLKGGRGRNLLALLTGYLPLSLVLGVGWLLVRGRITGGANAMPGDHPLALLVDLAERVFVITDRHVVAMRAAGFTKLWLWAMPGLIVLASLGWWRGRRDPRICLLAGSAVLTFGGYFFVPFDQGHGWGSRYFHSAWFVLPVLAAYYVNDPGVVHWTAVRSFAAALVASSLLVVVPAYLVGAGAFVARLVSQLPPAGAAGPLRLTFIEPHRGVYAADLVQNDPFLEGDDLRMLGGDPSDDAALARALAPEAREVARTPVATMWHLPESGTGAPQLLERTDPAARAR